MSLFLVHAGIWHDCPCADLSYAVIVMGSYVRLSFYIQKVLHGFISPTYIPIIGLSIISYLL